MRISDWSSDVCSSDLAESLYGSGIVLVLDNVERIVESGDAMSTLSSLARYVPAGVSLVLISRDTLPLDMGSTSDLDRFAEIGDEDLRFTNEEAQLDRKSVV